jgi:hypothetical protein
MRNLWLFRIKVIEVEQGALFRSKQSRSDFLRSLINRRPEGEIRKGYVWHIGNVSNLDNSSLFFAIGRTTKTSKELYDEKSGDFIAVEDEEAPFTNAFFDFGLGVLGIVPKARLSPSPKGVARNLEKLLNHQPEVADQGFRVEVVEIWDPEGFLQQIRQAYAVISFSVEFGKPNPFDVQKEFHEPMEKYLEASGGEAGKTTIRGENLDKDTVEDVTRSVASAGKNASARLRREFGQKPVVRHVKGDPMVVPAEDEELDNRPGVIEKIREAYQRVRRRGGE